MSGYNILCIATDKGLGGINEMMLFYERALLDLGCQVKMLGYARSPAMGEAKSERIFLPRSWRVGLWFSPRLRARVKALLSWADLIIFHNAAALRFLLRFIKDTPTLWINHSGKNPPALSFDYIATVSEQARTRLINEGLPPERVFVLANGVAHPPAFKPKEETQTPFCFGGLGRLVAEKDFATLINTLTQEGCEDMCLLLCGEGEERSALEAQSMSGRVKMLGWQDDKEAFFARLDALCVSSRREAFGLVIAEAMAAGVPGITTPSDGGQQLIRDGVNGLQVPFGDATAFAKALMRLRDEPDFRTRLVVQARKDFEQHYSFEAFRTRLKGVLKTIIAKEQDNGTD